jgi:DNA mismatch endonuclease, patch repair protein
MSKISGKDTKAEIALRKFLFAKGFRYRKNYSKLPGKPDIALPRLKTAIFVHGCFWHQHQRCKSAKLPSSNVDFWKRKLTANKVRDKQVIKSLKSIGWKVILIWECQLKSKINRQETFEKVSEILSKTRKNLYHLPTNL